MMKLRELLKDVDYKLVQGNLDLEVLDITYDSRCANENRAFVALKGFRVNGHDLIGWSESGKDYHTLLDYLTEELGLTDDEDICDYAVSLAKVNGMNLSKLFKTYEG